jgi:hypothetical protein
MRFNGDVLALHPAKFASTLKEGRALAVGVGGRKAKGKPSDPRDVRLRLRGGDERHYEEAEGEEEPDKVARHESLLRSRICGGILRVTCRGRKSNFAD